MKFLSIILCGFCLMCCKSKLENDSNQIIPKDIKGRWYLNRWTMYHTLDFSDNTVFVDNHIDTVFTLNYFVSNDTLITWSGDPDKKYKNQIINLTKDTFVIKGFARSGDTINYSRIKSEWKH